mmetsp:Transcript_7091/g.20688  ORF Transcript_7091/g.20688 Transcript_7091/m.20688 type:complete len:751 (+) Transcript_7091:60-2312(+)
MFPDSYLPGSKLSPIVLFLRDERLGDGLDEQVSTVRALLPKDVVQLLAAPLQTICGRFDIQGRFLPQEWDIGAEGLDRPLRRLWRELHEQVNEAGRAEDVPAREHVVFLDSQARGAVVRELSHNLAALRTRLILRHCHDSVAHGGNVLPQRLGAMGYFIHFVPQVLDLVVVLFQGLYDGILEVVDQDKVRKEGENVLNLQQRICLLPECNGFPNVFSLVALILLDHMLGNDQPQLLAQDVVLLRSVGDRLRQLQVHVKGVVHRLLVQMHHAVQLHAAPDLLHLHAKPEGKLRVVVRLPGRRQALHREVLQQGALLLVLAQERQEEVVDPAIRVPHPVDAKLQVPDRLLGMHRGLALVRHFQQRGQQLDWIQKLVCDHPGVNHLVRLQQEELWGRLVPQAAGNRRLPEHLDGFIRPVPLNQVLNDRLVVLDQARILYQLFHVAIAREEPRRRGLVEVLFERLEEGPEVLQGVVVLGRVLSVPDVRLVDRIQVDLRQPSGHHGGLSPLRRRHLLQPLLEESLEARKLADLDEFEAYLLERGLPAHVGVDLCRLQVLLPVHRSGRSHVVNVVPLFHRSREFQGQVVLALVQVHPPDVLALVPHLKGVQALRGIQVHHLGRLVPHEAQGPPLEVPLQDLLVHELLVDPVDHLDGVLEQEDEVVLRDRHGQGPRGHPVAEVLPARIAEIPQVVQEGAVAEEGVVGRLGVRLARLLEVDLAVEHPRRRHPREVLGNLLQVPVQVQLPGHPVLPWEL